MKTEFIGLVGNRQNYRDFAFKITPETEFEKSFISNWGDNILLRACWLVENNNLIIMVEKDNKVATSP
jgi:hypothetical protein